MPQSKKMGTNIKMLMEQAKKLVQEGEPDKAFETYEAILKENPEAAAAYLGIGGIYMKKGNFEEAENYLNGALHIKDKFAPAIAMLAMLNIKRGELDKALRQCTEALEINPKMMKVRLAMSGIYIKKENYEEAENFLKESLRYNPEFQEATLMLAKVLHKQNKTNEAIECIEQALVREPNSWMALYLLARFLMAENKVDLALEAIKKSLAVKPDNATALYFLGELYYKTEQYKNALHVLTNALELESSMDMVMINIKLAKTYIKTGDYDKARKILHKLSNGAKSLGTVHFMLAEIYFLQKKYRPAVEEYEAGLLHADKMIEKHPELFEIQKQDVDDEKKSVAYNEALSVIETEVSGSSGESVVSDL